MTDNSHEDPAEFDTDFRLTVDAADAGKRLDAVLAAHIDALSRNRIQSLIRSGDVTVGGAKVVEPKFRVNEGDPLALSLPEPEDPEPSGEDIPIAVVFEDEHLIVVDKPAGLVVHPGAGNWTGTLVNALIHHCGDSLSGIGGVRRPGIVHRIDKDTSGLLVVAKTDQAHQGLAAQFADHGRTGPLERSYAALVWGAPSNLKGTIDTNLARSQSNRQKMAVVKTSGRHAVTHWQVRERFGAADQPALASLMECRLETGRTHQIRVHMTHIGHPLIGDDDYGSGFKTKINRLDEPLKTVVGAFDRQALHAGLLAFEHPVSGKTLRFESPYPADFANLLLSLQNF
ncbi:MAG: RluA family pseudouridine synthase [Roseibium album]|uniref:Pseudouridine synthase n=1 Tax=Roseibium album TaxID=311410 RepID=A0A0M6Z5R1_9HYPH|nr:RluA family pseudouridine synthase [Roseibium album]MBG6142125.1 23S rRNA pseudouridine1911/1915/1917 synthase [Labrenzia sp. EL_142]MBG6175737.1 23S rRNA pseudouridine1911/1915/1917 synthase [Labrenzia sp. EL_132]MBG6230502.1 23S rRNA pseudouridine1911/1915/1917 synthase [Labrenzia sp. EL_208]MCR9057536.1 RluA family pseudouridine synthase [Paracoccaceae bacterium]CTQ57480.1 Ribosomal large subunit pseudouridine synthase D [Roseibium album]